jgi:putative sterol carrier protein
VATAEGSDAAAVDSIISLTEQNLMAVRSGDLNPQVAMLADKIKVKGKIGPAVYLFNLIAPRVQQ